METGLCRANIAVHLLSLREATPSRRHHQCQMVAGGLGCHKSRNPWASGGLRLRAKHSSAGPGSWNGTAHGITWEADPRHAELIRKSFGVTGRSVATPGIRDKADDIEGEVPIGKEAAGRYRTKTMRAQYLSSDRPETKVECRDLARKMQQPSNLDEMGLKRSARFLGVHPRLVWPFKWQKRVTRIESWCDTDHAACIRTRKSASGCALMLGGSTVCTYSKGQAVIALWLSLKQSITGWRVRLRKCLVCKALALQGTAGAVDIFQDVYHPALNSWLQLVESPDFFMRDPVSGETLDRSITSCADGVAKGKLFKDGQDLQQLVLAEDMALSDSLQKNCTPQHTGKQGHPKERRDQLRSMRHGVFFFKLFSGKQPNTPFASWALAFWIQMSMISKWNISTIGCPSTPCICKMRSKKSVADLVSDHSANLFFVA